MIKIEGLKWYPEEPVSALKKRAAKTLRCPEALLGEPRLLRRSLDAREGVCFVCSVAVEVQDEAVFLRKKLPRVSPYAPVVYAPPVAVPAPASRPVVVGAGPAGLFCALLLARAGARPILLERGREVERRQADVERFWSQGLLDVHSNVQFGEGGAGAFSDGKLNTGTKDPRHTYILEQLAALGAPADILVDAKPHVGTDFLHLLLKNLRQELLALGCELHFESQMTGLDIQNGQLRGLTVTEGGVSRPLPCTHAVLALGHSARDSLALLHESGVALEQKPFSLGVRIEHLQADMDAAQYKAFTGHPALPPSSYKLSCQLENGRTAYSFCVCPGGQVVAATSEEGQVVTNGMSAFARNLKNCNGGLLVSVSPADFGSDHPLAGVALQRRLEAAAFTLGGGDYAAPCQRVEDFLARRPSVGPGGVTPSYRPAVRWANLWDCLPDYVAEGIAEALPLLGRKVRGYDQGDAVLTAPETRSSSPVRIPRDARGQSNVAGLYPCGEGGGWAGGILSAAADGMKCAEWILEDLQ